MDYVKPRKLKAGDKILVVAPASSMDQLDSVTVQRGIDNLQKLSLKVEISKYASMRQGHTAGTPRERARILMEAFEDRSVDGIMAVWGGYNSNDLLEHLDFKVFRSNPKPFIGYSDITILNTALLEKSGLISFQGPSFITFTHSFLMDWEVNNFKEATMTTKAPRTISASPYYIDDPYYYLHPDKPPQLQSNPGWGIIKDGRAEGQIIGGHLGTLLALAGTQYWPDLRGKLLLLEEDEEGGPTGNIARSFRQLRHIGAFDEISGLIIGRIPSVVKFNEKDSIEMIVNDCLEGYDFPVVTGIDFGHTNPIATIPVGVRTLLDTFEKSLTFLEPGVN